jgi:hypothetical protein
MYSDYGNLAFLYEDRLRDAEKQRKQNQLIRAAQEYARRERGENQDGLLRRLMQLINVRHEPTQEANDAQHAPAL